MKFLRTLAMVSALFLAAGYSSAQDMDLGSFYGSQNIRFASAKYSPVMTPEQGNIFELTFGFNTLAQRSEGRKSWKMFYGVSLGGGGFAVNEAELGKYKKRDAAAGYGMIQFEGRFFENTDEDVRPYVGTYIGMARGQMWVEERTGLLDLEIGSMDLYYAGVEAGVHISSNSKYAIVLGGSVDIKMTQFEGEVKTYYPLMFTIGVCRWLGPM